MDKKDFSLPDFLLGEFPIKNDGFNDQRQFIIHKGITLIEIIPHEVFTHVTFENQTAAQYSYFGEDFTLCYHTSNGGYYNLEEKELLDLAFEWYREYLIWEDTFEDDF